jgi:hypothetical protein
VTIPPIDDPDRPAAAASDPDRPAAAASDPAADDGSAPETADDSAPTTGARDAETRRRRWWVAGISAGAVLVVLLLCTAAGLVIAGVDRIADRGEDRQVRTHQTAAACHELERRLNRVSPPGAALDLRRRAAAVRDENAAVRPFVEQIDSYGEGHDRYARWVEWWRQLVAARISYADALDRQAAGGEPAFYLAPQTDGGRSVTERLEDATPACAGSVRRLAAPDL